MKQLHLAFLILISLQIWAQKDPTMINGTIINDSIPVENIHIFNKNSQKGSISNSKGEFKIEVNIRDTLTISGIQFYPIEVIINKNILRKNKLKIELLQKINTLKEVELKTHDLIGNLSLDSKKYKDTLESLNSSALGIENIYFNIPLWKKMQKINASKFHDPTDPMVPVGSDIIVMILFIFNPVVEKITKRIKKEKKKKEKERVYQSDIIKAPDNIREDFGDVFFINTLNISKSEIDSFIIFCKPKGLIDLYMANRKIEIIDLFIKQSKKFNNHQK